MALIQCPECGREVSDQADACPHCGLPLAARTRGGERVRTSEDSALTRSRGCGDIIIYGPLLLIGVLILAALCAG